MKCHLYSQLSPQRLQSSAYLYKWRLRQTKFPRWYLDFQISKPATAEQRAKSPTIALRPAPIISGPNLSYDVQPVNITAWRERSWNIGPAFSPFERYQHQRNKGRVSWYKDSNIRFSLGGNRNWLQYRLGYQLLCLHTFVQLFNTTRGILE